MHMLRTRGVMADRDPPHPRPVRLGQPGPFHQVGGDLGELGVGELGVGQRPVRRQCPPRIGLRRRDHQVIHRPVIRTQTGRHQRSVQLVGQPAQVRPAISPQRRLQHRRVIPPGDQPRPEMLVGPARPVR